MEQHLAYWTLNMRGKLEKEFERPLCQAQNEITQRIWLICRRVNLNLGPRTAHYSVHLQTGGATGSVLATGLWVQVPRWGQWGPMWLPSCLSPFRGDHRARRWVRRLGIEGAWVTVSPYPGELTWRIGRPEWELNCLWNHWDLGVFFCYSSICLPHWLTATSMMSTSAFPIFIKENEIKMKHTTFP